MQDLRLVFTKEQASNTKHHSLFLKTLTIIQLHCLHTVYNYLLLCRFSCAIDTIQAGKINFLLIYSVLLAFHQNVYHLTQVLYKKTTCKRHHYFIRASINIFFQLKSSIREFEENFSYSYFSFCKYIKNSGFC